MKILFVASYMNENGGIQRYDRDLLSALKLSGAKVLVLEGNGHTLAAKLWLILRAVLFSMFFRPELTIFCHINFAPILNIVKPFGSKFAFMTYGIDVWDIKDARKAQALKDAAAIFSISNYTKDRMLQADPSLMDKIYLLSNPVHGEEFSPGDKSAKLMERYGLDQGEKIIFTLGRLSAKEKYKGYDKVLLALPEVLKEFPKVKYLLSGEGDDRPRVEELIKKLGIGSHVVLTGYVPARELADHYNLCDLFAMPSQGEGFGFVFIEALACGKPVIAGNADGSVDAVLGGETGLLVDPEDVGAVKKAILSALMGQAPARILDGKFLREKTLGAYGFDKFALKVKNILDELQR